MMRKNDFSYVVFGCGSYYKRMFDGIDSMENCQYCYEELDHFLNRVPFQNFLYHATTSAKFKRLVGIKASDLWNTHWMRYEFNDNRITGRKILFLFLQNNKYAHDEVFLMYLKNKFPNSKNIFWITNTLETHQEDLNFLKRCYDVIMTFSEIDARDNGFYYHQWCYKQVRLKRTKKNDLFFCGWDKGRGRKLVDIYEYLIANGVKCDFTILKADKETPKVDGIRYSDRYIDYDEVFSRMLESNCLLEIMPGHKDPAPTLRVAEAIAMSRKLLTNNTRFQSNVLYNPQQMKIVTDAKLIDLNWLTDKSIEGFTDVDNLSPDRFLLDVGEYVFSNGE